MKLIRALALLTFLSLLCLADAFGAELVYKGEQTLYQHTVWHGDVLIDGILTIAPEASLEIRPGTRVRLARIDTNGDGFGESELFIQGEFLALGTASRPILFTSAEAEPRESDWGAINMMGEEKLNRMEHCIVEYGYRGFHAHFARAEVKNCLFRHNTRGMQFQESEVRIEGCEVSQNLNGMQFRNSKVQFENSRVSGNYWGLRCVYSELVMKGSLVENNFINGVSLRDSTIEARGNLIRGNRRGLYLQSSTGEIIGNALLENSEHGIFFEASDFSVEANLIRGNGRGGIRALDSRGQARGNDLSGNGEYALIVDGVSDFQAPENWWGTLDTGALGDQVRDGLTRKGMGRAIQDAPLAGPPELGPFAYDER